MVGMITSEEGMAAMRAGRGQSRIQIPLILVAILLLYVGCATGRAQVQEPYDQQVLDLDRTFRTGVEELSSARWDAERARKAARLAAQVAEQLHRLVPPPRFVRGHRSLVRYYLVTEDFFSLDALRIDPQSSGEDISDLEERAARMADELLQLRIQIHRALPFLAQTGLTFPPPTLTP